MLSINARINFYAPLGTTLRPLICILNARSARSLKILAAPIAHMYIYASYVQLIRPCKLFTVKICRHMLFRRGRRQWRSLHNKPAGRRNLREFMTHCARVTQDVAGHADS